MEKDRIDKARSAGPLQRAALKKKEFEKMKYKTKYAESHKKA